MILFLWSSCQTVHCSPLHQVPCTRYLVQGTMYLMILPPNYSVHMYCTPLHQVPLGPGGEVFPGWADHEGRSNRRLLPPIQRGANKNQVPILCGSDLSDFWPPVQVRELPTSTWKNTSINISLPLFKVHIVLWELPSFFFCSGHPSEALYKD